MLHDVNNVIELPPARQYGELSVTWN